MDYESACMIFAISFWVLCACAVICGLAWTYCQIQYYKWARDEREQDLFVHAVRNAVAKAVEGMQQDEACDTDNKREIINQKIEEKYADFVM